MLDEQFADNQAAASSAATPSMNRPLIESIEASTLYSYTHSLTHNHALCVKVLLAGGQTDATAPRVKEHTNTGASRLSDGALSATVLLRFFRRLLK